MPGNDTLLLDRSTWSLVLDAQGNIAVATEPYSLAQDAASAIKTFAGECYWDTTLGQPYLTQALGVVTTLAAIKALFVSAAETVPGVASAQVFISSTDDRGITGQVQVTSQTTGQVETAPFEIIQQGGV